MRSGLEPGYYKYHEDSMCGSAYKFSLLVDNIVGTLEDEMKSKNGYTEDEIWGVIDQSVSALSFIQ